MGLDLWFRADVARILQATHEAMTSTAAVAGVPEDDAGRERVAGYRQGFGAALRAVATAFGLTEPPQDRMRPALGTIDGEVIHITSGQPGRNGYG